MVAEISLPVDSLLSEEIPLKSTGEPAKTSSRDEKKKLAGARSR